MWNSNVIIVDSGCGSGRLILESQVINGSIKTHWTTQISKFIILNRVCKIILKTCNVSPTRQ